MRHHGITTVGATAREAFSLMKEFVRAARIQLMMEVDRPAGAGDRAGDLRARRGAV